ncbi:hypothetical protein AAHC03_013943 [Spirometra sp. Aus1]
MFSYYFVETAEEPTIIDQNVPSAVKIQHRPDLQNFVVDSGNTQEKRKQLPNLENINWPEREFLRLPFGAPGSIQAPLEAKFSRGQMRTMWKLFLTFVDVMDELGFSDRWMIYSGSLFSSFRHHDIGPWDDDLDVLVDQKVRPALWKKMRSLRPKFIIRNSGLRDKIYAELIQPCNATQDAEGSRKLSMHNWGWPYVDISYYKSNVTHIRELSKPYGQKYVFPKSDVFPLLFRPFYKYWAPAPRNTFAFLLQTYHESVHCASPSYIHPYEKRIKGQAVPCTALADRYAFVEHSLRNSSVQGENRSSEDLDWVRERLILGGKVIHEIDLVGPRREGHVDTFVLQIKPEA